MSGPQSSWTPGKMSTSLHSAKGLCATEHGLYVVTLLLEILFKYLCVCTLFHGSCQWCLGFIKISVFLQSQSNFPSFCHHAHNIHNLAVKAVNKETTKGKKGSAFSPIRLYRNYLGKSSQIWTAAKKFVPSFQ